MAFSSYTSARSVVQAFQITYTEAVCITETPIAINNYFRQDLEEFVRDGVADNSESAICENMIAPILKAVWRSYKEQFLLWSHETLKYSEHLSGVPDYILARRSPLGKIVLDQPYLLVVEAKQDNFDEGWGQCLAAMVAAQKLNSDQTQTVFGIVSNGEVWEFGRLSGVQFTKNRSVYLFQDLDRLFAAVNHVFSQCEVQLQAVV